ncbi:MAG: diacylglycerol kinase family protein [Rhizobium altiplani]|uniref:diacylglycerol/lipid kinase family protein n=1 Tax=Rhizobium altiplani TaxID=1864509 RepID=UPI0030F281BF
MKIGIVLNPASGRRGKKLFWSALRRAIEARFTNLSLRETKGHGDAERFGRELADDGADLVIAVGGDGTIGEVAGGILKSHRPGTAFSFIATGTGCDFARNFPVSRDPATIANRLTSPTVRQIDAGLLTCDDEDGDTVSRHFANIASFGVSGHIVQAVNEAPKGRRLPGPMVFFFHSLLQILRYTPRDIRLRLDGEDIYEGPITAVAVANGAWFGGGMKVAPDADVADGLFDVVIIRGAGRLKVLTLMNSIYSGGHLKSPLVSIHRARLVEAWPIGREPVPIDSDGEAPGQLPARFEILVGALSLKI